MSPDDMWFDVLSFSWCIRSLLLDPCQSMGRCIFLPYGKQSLRQTPRTLGPQDFSALFYDLTTFAKCAFYGIGARECSQ